MNSTKLKLVYDINALPKGLDPGNMIKIWEQHNVVFFSTTEGGVKPRLFGVDDEQMAPLFVDMDGKEIDWQTYSDQFREKEYWEKELYNCHNSPIYYWNNFGTHVWPATSEDMAKFMKEIGMEQLAAADNEEAKKLWDAQKERMKEALKFITVEHLKDRKVHIDILRAEYNNTIVKLENELKDAVRLFDTNNAPLSDKKRCGNLIEKIKKCLPVPKEYSEKYRTPKGKWDYKMLFVTDYKALLQMYYDIYKTENRKPELVDSTAK